MYFTIRKANLNDLETVRELNLQLYHHDFEFDKELNLKHPNTPAGTEYYRSRISNPKYATFVAETDDKVIGYIIGKSENKYRYRKGITGELENMFVLLEYRTQGVGTKLVTELVSWMKSKKVDRIYVSAYIKNKNAVSFYQTVGFKQWEMGLEMKIS